MKEVQPTFSQLIDEMEKRSHKSVQNLCAGDSLMASTYIRKFEDGWKQCLDFLQEFKHNNQDYVPGDIA